MSLNLDTGHCIYSLRRIVTMGGGGLNIVLAGLCDCIIQSEDQRCDGVPGKTQHRISREELSNSSLMAMMIFYMITIIYMMKAISE